MKRNSKLIKLVRDMVREELETSNKFYLNMYQDKHFPYENDENSQPESVETSAEKKHINGDNEN